jgi:hypothetical protein
MAFKGLLANNGTIIWIGLQKLKYRKDHGKKQKKKGSKRLERGMRDKRRQKKVKR